MCAREPAVERVAEMLVLQVYLAMQHGLRPVGTIAHEWIMAIGAKEDYELPNLKAMDAWERGKFWLHARLMFPLTLPVSLPLKRRQSFAHHVDGHLHYQDILRRIHF